MRMLGKLGWFRQGRWYGGQASDETVKARDRREWRDDIEQQILMNCPVCGVVSTGPYEPVECGACGWSLYSCMLCGAPRGGYYLTGICGDCSQRIEEENLND